MPGAMKRPMTTQGQGMQMYSLGDDWEKGTCRDGR